MAQGLPARDHDYRPELLSSSPFKRDRKKGGSFFASEYFYELVYRVSSGLLGVFFAALAALVYGIITAWRFNSLFIVIEGSILFAIMLLSEHLRFSVFVAQEKRSIAHKKFIHINELVSGKIETELDIDALRSRVVSRSLVKEMSERMTACTALLLLSPLLLIVSLLIGLSSRGPILVKARSVGADGNFFDLVRFRTSFSWAQPRTSVESDLTRVGYFLRRTHIDGIPMLFNVMAGDMNFVGPRPLSVTEDYAARREFAARRELDIWQMRNIVKPGITGLAQVEDPYLGDLVGPYKRQLFYDLRYIADLSVHQEIRILLKTFYVVLTGKDAC